MRRVTCSVEGCSDMRASLEKPPPKAGSESTQQAPQSQSSGDERRRAQTSGILQVRCIVKSWQVLGAMHGLAQSSAFLGEGRGRTCAA